MVFLGVRRRSTAKSAPLNGSLFTDTAAMVPFPINKKNSHSNWLSQVEKSHIAS